MVSHRSQNDWNHHKMKLIAAAAVTATAVSLHGCNAFSTPMSKSMTSCSPTSPSCRGPLHATLTTMDHDYVWKYSMTSTSGSSSSNINPRWKKNDNRYFGSTSFNFGSNSTTTTTTPSSSSMLGFDVSLPYLPTRQQVNGLSLVELQMACRDRNILFSDLQTQEELSNELLNWTSQQHKQRVHQRRQTSPPQSDTQDKQPPKPKKTMKKKTNTISEQNLPSVVSMDMNNLDTIKPLISRRQALMASKTTPKSKPSVKKQQKKSTKEYMSDLSKAFEAPSSMYSNYQVQQIYKEAKIADQLGNIDKALSLLHLLKTATPHDMRIPRRLSRLYLSQGQISLARSILQEALIQSPQNPHLLHGLASLQAKYFSSYDKAKELYKKAIRADPYMPNAHHALGTLEHSKGNIKAATEILRNGIQYCPDNHRLHHAMGDLYRDANMHTHAIQSYNRALDICSKQKKEYGKSFLHTALSYVMYDLGQIQECKVQLQSSIDNNPLHAQGWLAYAQLEQSEENMKQARLVYQQAALTFEQHQQEKQGKSSPSHQWLHLYLSWAAMEQKYGDYQDANNVYSRAASDAFAHHPNHKYEILLSWATFQWRRQYYDRARTLLQIASTLPSNDENGQSTPHRALPIRLHGQLEMTSLKDYKTARNVLFEGARKLVDSTTSAILVSADTKEAIELAKLYHLWAMSEWHLGQFERTEVLLQQAMRLVPADDEYPANKEMRVALLYTNARFMLEVKDEPILAQHCICLALSQNNQLPQLWQLWGRVAKTIGDDKLALQCQKQMKKAKRNNGSNGALSDLVVLLNVASADADLTLNLDNMLRKAPWHNKLKGGKKHHSNHRHHSSGPSETAAEWLDQLIFPKPKRTTKRTIKTKTNEPVLTT